MAYCIRPTTRPDGTPMPVLPKQLSRCSGHCCQAFTGLGDEADIARSTAREEDGPLIRDMLIPLGYWSGEKGWAKAGNPRHFWWTCKHFDEANGACGIYDKRPHMCRSYPNGPLCSIEACTAKFSLGSPGNEGRTAAAALITEMRERLGTGADSIDAE